MPHRPVVLLPCDAGQTRHRFSFRPACQLIKGVYRGWRTTLEPRRSAWIAERTKVEQHSYASPGFAGMDESPSNEGISEPMCAVGRVRDDVLGKGLIRFQEVVPPCTVASVDKVRRHHLVSCGLKHLRDGSVAASRFPDIALKALDGQKRPCGLWWGWVKFVCSSLRIAEIFGRNF